MEAKKVVQEAKKPTTTTIVLVAAVFLSFLDKLYEVIFDTFFHIVLVDSSKIPTRPWVIKDTIQVDQPEQHKNDSVDQTGEKEKNHHYVSHQFF